MNSHPLDYSFGDRRSIERKSRHPAPVILTPHDVPEFVIPRSPSLYSSSSEVEELSLDERRRNSRINSRLSVPQEDAQCMRNRSHSSPLSPEMPQSSGDPNYVPDRRDLYRKHSHQLLRTNPVPPENMPRRHSRETAQYSDQSHAVRQHSYSPGDRRYRDRVSPEGHRRRLPPTPEELNSFNYEQKEPSRPTSRQLPSPPVRDDGPPSFSNSGSSSPRPNSKTGRRLPPTPAKDLSDEFRIESKIRQASRDVSARNVSQTPPLSNSHRSVKSNVRSNGTNGYPPDVHESTITTMSPESRKYCLRRPSDQSLNEYVGTPCTCPPSQASSISPSHEISHSSSDTEDPSALGILSDAYNDSPGKQSTMQTSVSSHSGFNDLRVFQKEPVVSKPSISITGKPPGVTTSNSWSETSDSGHKKTGLGLLHFCVQYFPVRKRLRVSIMKAEGLAGELRPDLELHTFVKICLMPGKLGKEHSRIVKRSRDAVFNQEFFFDNITGAEIKSKAVSIRVCHHVGKQFQKDIMIGEIEVPLKDVPDLMTKKEIRLTEPLKPKLNIKKLGRIRISCCLELESQRLTIDVIKVDDLPKCGITGCPDPCVRITVNQNNRIQTKQTRTLKHTTSAAYNEAVMFLVSTKPQDLETTEVTIAVVDTIRSGSGEDIMGQAFLGCLASDKVEIEQWKNAIAHPGKEYKATHSLKLPY